MINQYIEGRSKVFACFLDISKAFDIIWWNGLFYKLHELGITNRLWYILYDWFQNSEVSVLVNGVTSSPFKISRSIKQGGILSMLMFAIYFNDIHDYVRGSNDIGVHLNEIYMGSPAFADDIVLLSNTKRDMDIMLNRVQQYSELWRFKFSAKKCKCVVFGETEVEHTKGMTNRTFELGKFRVEESDSTVHVGIDLRYDLSNTIRVHTACVKARKIYYGLTTIGMKPHGLSPIISKQIFNKVCLSSMLYGVETWSFLKSADLKSMDKFQNNALRYAQGSPNRTHGCIIRGLVNQLSICSIIDRKKLLFARQLIQLNNNSIAKCVFINRLYDWLFQRYRKGFVPDLFKILVKYNLEDYVLRYATGGIFPSKNSWKTIVNEAVCQSDFEQSRNELAMKGDVSRYLRIHTSGIYSLYHIAKKCPDNYVLIMDLAKLITVPDKIYNVTHCKICNRQINDIVMHIIMECCPFNTHRNAMWDDIHGVISINQAVELFTKTEEETLDIFLGKKWMALRKQRKRIIFYSIIATYAKDFIKGIRETIPWLQQDA